MEAINVSKSLLLIILKDKKVNVTASIPKRVL